MSLIDYKHLYNLRRYKKINPDQNTSNDISSFFDVLQTSAKIAAYGSGYLIISQWFPMRVYAMSLGQFKDFTFFIKKIGFFIILILQEIVFYTYICIQFRWTLHTKNVFLNVDYLISLSTKWTYKMYSCLRKKTKTY